MTTLSKTFRVGGYTCDQTDLVIARKFRDLAELRKAEGFEAARRAAVDDLAIVIAWLDAAVGPRATYNLIQGVADNLVEMESSK
jgi:hypothetical protein